MMAGRLQQYIATSGRAHSMLYYGPKLTPQIDAKLEFAIENAVDKLFDAPFSRGGGHPYLC